MKWPNRALSLSATCASVLILSKLSGADFCFWEIFTFYTVAGCTTKIQANLHLVSLSNHEERLESGPPILMLNAFNSSQDATAEPVGLDTPWELDSPSSPAWSFQNNLPMRYLVDNSYGAVFSSHNFSPTLIWISDVSEFLGHCFKGEPRCKPSDWGALSDTRAKSVMSQT